MYDYWLFVMAEDGWVSEQIELYKCCKRKVSIGINSNIPLIGSKWTEDYINTLKERNECYKLGDIYQEGIIVAKDNTESFKWYKK